jgi:hypothetical protein
MKSDAKKAQGFGGVARLREEAVVTRDGHVPVPVFGTHRHIALIYEGQGENVQAAAAFIRDGLERDHYCLYVHDESSQQGLLTAFTASGIDAASAVAQGRLELVMTSHSVLADGRFDPDVMVGMLQAKVRQALERGFEGLSVAGEMSWALGRHPGVDQLVTYEALCSGFVEANTVVALCQYDRKRFDAQALRQVLLTHPWVLIDGRLCRNFHHVPAGGPLAAALEVPVDVDALLVDLVIRDAAERMVAGATMAIEGSDADGAGVEDASRLVKIYSELVLFKRQVLSRAEKCVSGVPKSRKRAENDAAILQLKGELVALQMRLEFWQDRVRRIVGLDYDADGRRVRFGERSVRLSRRESQLIAALISQNGRSLPPRELLWRAWGGNHLAEAQVRTYIAQLRKKLAGLEMPAALVNEPGLGYSLRFDPQLTNPGGAKA